MIAFDAPNRSVCVVKREKTNTPLQALVLLNDPQFVEAARVLAQRVLANSEDSSETAIGRAFRLVCGKHPNEEELRLLSSQYEAAVKRYEAHPDLAEALLGIGEYKLAEDLDKTKVAALTTVANTIMNFDEAYSKR